MTGLTKISGKSHDNADLKKNFLRKSYKKIRSQLSCLKKTFDELAKKVRKKLRNAEKGLKN